MGTVTGLIPTIWSASILREYEKATIFGSCLSRLYEGEIAKVGDSVKVPRIGAVSVRPYVKRTAITYDDVDSSTIDITIDQSDYWALRAEDIEKIQAAPDFLDAATRNAAYALADKTDIYAAGILKAGAGVKEDLGTTGEPISIRSGEVYGLFALIGQKLTENNIPQVGRWLVAPPWLYKKLVLARARKDNPNGDITTNAYVGRFLGFDVLVSNNCPFTTETIDGEPVRVFSVLAGIRDAGTLVHQITETESLRDPAQFGELVRGLSVYTAKVLQPSALALATIIEGEELSENFPDQ
jgi:hypothetical protein